PDRVLLRETDDQGDYAQRRAGIHELHRRQHRCRSARPLQWRRHVVGIPSRLHVGGTRRLAPSHAVGFPVSPLLGFPVSPLLGFPVSPLLGTIDRAWIGVPGDVEIPLEAQPQKRGLPGLHLAYALIDMLVQIVDRHFTVTVPISLSRLEALYDGG